MYNEKLNNKTSKIDAVIKLLKSKLCLMIDNKIIKKLIN